MSDDLPYSNGVRPILLALDGREVQVVIDALVAFANAEEAGGDACGVVATADAVAAHLRELRELDSVWTLETVRQAGLSRYRNRPQG